jgi:hypothetical protein
VSSEQLSAGRSGLDSSPSQLAVAPPMDEATQLEPHARLRLRRVAFRSSNGVGSDGRSSSPSDAPDMPLAVRDVAGPKVRLSERVGAARRPSNGIAPSTELPVSPVSPQRLRARWHAAFDAADDALRAASGFLAADDLRELRSRLASERATTAELLQAYAHAEGEGSVEPSELQPWMRRRSTVTRREFPPRASGQRARSRQTRHSGRVRR